MNKKTLVKDSKKKVILVRDNAGINYYKHFIDLMFESAVQGKIHTSHKCLFCGSKLDPERTKAIQVRIGRIRFLLREIETGSETAEKLLIEILTLGEYLGGRDIPEDNPDWWVEKAQQIILEKGRT